MSGTPVVVTGIGAVSGFGVGVDVLWRASLSGRSALAELRLFPTASHRTRVACELPAGLLAIDRRTSRAEAFAVAAAREAAVGLPVGLLATDRAGVFFGSSTGALWEGERWFAGSQRGEETSLQAIAAQQNDGPGNAVARAFSVRGPVLTMSTACTSGNVAIAAALDALRTGEVDIALVGGADELTEVTYAGFNALRAVDPGQTRPFRAGRAGLSMGEGAGVLVLEARWHADAAGRRPLCELAGAGRSCDAHHVSAPSPDGSGAAAAIAAALADAAEVAANVTFVNAHGTGTPHNDDSEAKALALVFGDRAARLPVTSSKSQIGHLLGAAGGIEAVLSVLAIRERMLPATFGADPADPGLGLDVVIGAPRPLPGHNVGVSTNLAFGGNNCAIVLRSCR